ncbi:RND family transporter [Marinobacter sp. NP-4(2019)]|uniref:efflux RND transporter permease subunit n=1 Tax=Marinobacter sp. NP-4(2019) TaxID=2488665 RepID=UPI000FC3E987|nr:MMPL family transporter [Marinobacter sp. NP-4(2019)]AZT83255.1 RND family transporter [Marinobacter sp. NP-4(2019)]
MNAQNNEKSDFEVVRQLDAFDRNSGSLLERVIFNNRALILMVFALVTLFLGYSARDIRLDASFEKMIPLQHQYIVNYYDHKADLSGLANTLRIAVENTEGTVIDADYLNTLRLLNDEIFLMEGVDRPYMKSLWTPAVRWVGVTEYGLDGGPVIPDDYDGSAESLAQVRANIEKSGEIGRLVANNFQSSIILVPLNEDSGIEYRDLVNRLNELEAKYEPMGVKIYITGFSKLVGDLILGLEQVLQFFLIAIIICTGVIYAYTRCVTSTALVVICSLTAVSWLIGLLPLLGYQLDPYSVLVPFLVFAIGMSHGAQKMNGIMADIGRGTHKLVAARYTFRRLFVAGITALLADAVGFAVLMMIDIQAIQELAIAASLGVATLIFTNLVMLPLLLSYTGVNRQAAMRSVAEEQRDRNDVDHKKHPLWEVLDKFTRRRFASVAVVVSAGLAIVGLVISADLKIGDLGSGAPELRPDSEYNMDNAFIVDNYSISSDIYVVMVETGTYECVNYDNLLMVEALERQLQNLDAVESTNSFAGLSKQSAVGMNEGNLRWYELPRTQGLLNAIATRAPRELFNQSCDLLSVYAYLKDHKAETLQAVADVVERFSAEHSTDDIRFLNAAGNAGIQAATNSVVKTANYQMLLMVYAAVIVLAYITFRSFKAVICAVIPLLLTSILCEALMVILDIGVKVSTLPVIALGVGIGVDYALYILSVTIARLRAGQSLSDAYYEALLFTGKVVALTGITLGVAVSTWYFSPIQFQADMGILLAFMFIWNMLGAGLLLPALAHFMFRQQVR